MGLNKYWGIGWSWCTDKVRDGPDSLGVRSFNPATHSNINTSPMLPSFACCAVTSSAAARSGSRWTPARRPCGEARHCWRGAFFWRLVEHHVRSKVPNPQTQSPNIINHMRMYQGCSNGARAHVLTACVRAARTPACAPQRRTETAVRIDIN